VAARRFFHPRAGFWAQIDKCAARLDTPLSAVDKVVRKLDACMATSLRPSLDLSRNPDIFPAINPMQPVLLLH